MDEGGYNKIFFLLGTVIFKSLKQSLLLGASFQDGTTGDPVAHVVEEHFDDDGNTIDGSMMMVVVVVVVLWCMELEPELGWCRYRDIDRLLHCDGICGGSDSSIRSRYCCCRCREGCARGGGA